MTVRALIIGMVLALAVALFGYANDWVCRLPYVASDLMPVSVYGVLLLGLLALNPGLHRLGVRRLRGPEWAVISALFLAACAIPGPGLLWQFHNALVMPHHIERVTPGWKATRDRPSILEYVPDAMLVDPSPAGVDREEDVVNGFVQGLAEGNTRLEWSEVPWRAWLRPYAFYLPLILLMGTATVCLALILHVQWSRHEHLPYPMATFAGALLGTDPDRPCAVLMGDRTFWIGVAVSGTILALNGAHTWWPEYLIPVPQYVDLRPLAALLPWLSNVPGGLDALLPRFFFAAIGLAFLINAEVSFSVGISMLAYAVVFGFLAGVGLSINNEYLAGGVLGFQLFGAYLGAMLFLLYTGRHYYLNVIRCTLGLAPPPPSAPHARWAGRALALSAAAILALLNRALGLDLVSAAALILLFGMLFTVVTRINAETGVLFVQPTWQPVAVLLAVFGAHALGPTGLIVAGILSMVLTIDPRVCLMPLVANGLKIAETQDVRIAKAGLWVLGGFALCLGAALPVTLYIQYGAGGGTLYGWANTATRMPFDLLVRELQHMAALGTLPSVGESVGAVGLLRCFDMAPSPTFLCAAGAGLAAVILCHLARLRWPWWPLHPVLFLVWGTLVSRWFAGSFLLGWLIKWAVVRFGTHRTYQHAQRFCIGLIAGEMVVGILWMIQGAVYYLVTHTPPPMFRVHL